MVMRRGANDGEQRKVRGRGQVGPRGLDSEKPMQSRIQVQQRPAGVRLSAKQRLGGGLKNIGGISRGGKVDLRRKLNEKTGKTAAVGDLRQLIGQDSSGRLKRRESAGLRTTGARSKLISPVLAAAVSDLCDDLKPRARPTQVRRPKLPARSQLTAIRRTIDNPIPPTAIKFTVRNPLAEERFQDLTISRNFSPRRKQPVEMEVDDDESEEEESPPPRPAPRAKKAVAASKPSAAPFRATKGKMVMNRVKFAALPENVMAKEVTELCEDFGPILRVNRITKGTFEVDFENEEDARKTVMQCSEATLDGEPLQVSLLPSVSTEGGASSAPAKPALSVKQRLQPKPGSSTAKRSQAAKKRAQ